MSPVLFYTLFRHYSCRIASNAEILTARPAGIIPDTIPMPVENRIPNIASHSGITEILEPYIGKNPPNTDPINNGPNVFSAKESA